MVEQAEPGPRVAWASLERGESDAQRFWSGAAPDELRFEYVDDGRARGTADELVVELAASDWVAYEVNVAQRAVLGVKVATHGSGPTPIELSIDGTAVPLDDHGSGLHEGSSHAVARGRHVIRVDCGAGRAAISYIEVIADRRAAENNAR